MLEFFYFGTNTCTETFAPLIYCVIAHALLQAMCQTAYAASAHRCHKLLPGTAVATVLPKFYSQPGLNVDCWKPHVWRIKAGV